MDVSQPQPTPSEPGGSASAMLPNPRRSGVTTAIIAAAAVLVAGAGAGAFAVSSYLSGGGAQPEDVLSSGAMAFAKVDLDPAANQKLAVYKLSKKFPGLLKDVGEDRAIKDSVFGAIIEDTPGGSNYENDIKPWLGDRVGVAVYPPLAAGKEPRLAIAVQFTDEAKMQASMQKDAKVDDIDWAVRDGYVVVTENGEADDLVADNGAGTLGAQPAFASDIAALDGSQLAVAWADLGRLAAMAADAMGAGFADVNVGGNASGTMEDGMEGLPPEFASQMAEMQKQMESYQKQMTTQAESMKDVTGRLAMGVRAAGDYLEVQGKMFGASGGAGGAAGKPGTNLAGQMPADVLGALSATGLGDALAGQWKGLAAMTPMALFGMAEGAAPQGDADFAALFGDEFAAVVGSVSGDEPKLALRTRGGDMEQAKKLVTALTSMFGLDAPTAKKIADGFVLGNDAELVEAAASGGSRLGETDSFAKAVPDADGAAIVFYANFDKIAQAGGSAEDAAEIEALDAVGFSATAADNPSFRLRVTTD